MTIFGYSNEKILAKSHKLY